MKAIKVLIIALVVVFTLNTVNAQTVVPGKAGAEKTQKKGHKKHHHKKHGNQVVAKK